MSDAAPGWTPVRRLFLRRTLIVAVLTFVAFTVLMGIGQLRFDTPPQLTLLVPAAMTLILLIEDVSRWRALSAERWQIEETQLIHDSLDGRASIPLAEIAQVRTGWGGQVILQLASGKRIALRHLENPAEVVRRIEAARQNPLGPAQNSGKTEPASQGRP